MNNSVDDRTKMPVVVATPADLAALGATLRASARVAVDTESDSLFSYFEKVCLLQFSTQDTDYIVDPLGLNGDTNAVATLAPLFADANIEKVFHASEYDILCLKRDYHFTFANIFDTMIAARVLGWKSVGLGAILQARYGVVLNKKFQRADWGKRPLTAEQIAYAREDTHYLLRLRDLQEEELQRLGRLTEAREEFERLTRVEPTPRRFDPDAYRNLSGARELNPVQLGVLRELFRWRDVQARHEDRPPFKILSESMLVHLAEMHPASTRSLAHLSGVSEYVTQRYADAILQAVARGEAAPQTSRPHSQAKGEWLLDNAARNRLGKLKEWRKKRAEERGVDTDVIVSNDVLFSIARENPRTVEALIAASELGPWKANAYGEELLAVIRKQ